jgi:threonine dehydratase
MTSDAQIPPASDPPGSPVGADEVRAAGALIGGNVRRTPVMHIRAGEISGLRVDVVLKLELLQHTGSFKARGAFHRVLTSDVPAAGVITASGGNHGAALAYAASRLGHRAEIFVPATSPAMKAERIRSLGATVVLGGERYDDAQEAANVRAAETGALMIHPYNHAATVAGAGTCAMEFDEQAPGLHTILTSTGGGGLTSGTAAWFGDRGAQVVSVEPETSQCLAAALMAGHPVDVPVEGVAIDSLGARQVGAVPFAVCSAFGVRAVTVSDDAIRSAQSVLWHALRLVVEPGGAAAFAAILSGAYVPRPDEKMGIIVCGANCDPSTVTSGQQRD